MTHRNLLEHHLHFLSRYRGRRESLPGVELIHAYKPAFNIAFLLDTPGLEKIPRGYQLYLPDWSAADATTLEDKGWTQMAEMVYQTLGNKPASWQRNPALRVRRVNSRKGIDRFSYIQGRGFCETEADFQEWHPWLRQKNLENLDDPDQSFYVGSLAGRAVGVNLAVYHQHVMGIYAVTTLPEFRNQGVSAGILRRAVRDAQKIGVTGVILQVFAGSYAEGFYERLGFGKAFSCRIFRKA